MMTQWKWSDELIKKKLVTEKHMGSLVEVEEHFWPAPKEEPQHVGSQRQHWGSHSLGSHAINAFHQFTKHLIIGTLISFHHVQIE
jgi:hypothetical protein